MVKDRYELICNGVEVRANLIALKKELKEDSNKRAFAYLLGGDYSSIVRLLEHEDAKVRKNTALILGEMEDEELLDVLMQAYQKESQRFVKSSYLKAISKYDYQRYLTALQEQIRELEVCKEETSNEKHRREELTVLRNMVLKYNKPGKHKFVGFDQENEVILLTSRKYREITKDQLPEGTYKMLAGGIRLVTQDLKTVLAIRTFSDILFPVKKVGMLPNLPQKAAEQLNSSDLTPMLLRLHQGSTPFYYRIELKSKMSLENRSAFVKKLTAQLEKESNGMLINSTTEYEVEIRLVENKDGLFIPLLKLYTLPDQRFSYRKNSLASSISPVNAALFMQLAKAHLTEGAQVLDPFCGTGTMLIERCKFKEANPLYGIDIYEEAIVKGRENAEQANVKINFINRDFFEFKHEYFFDEIVTNLPGITRTKNKDEILTLYRKFLEKAPKILKDTGFMLLYTREAKLLELSIRQSKDFLLLEKWIILEKDGSTLFAVRREK